MSYEQKDMSATIFPNKDRQKDTHPSLKGKGMLYGKMCWVSGWTATMKDGTKYLKLSFKEMDQQVNAPRERVSEPVDLNDDIPF